MTGVQIALYTWCPLIMLSFSTVPCKLQLAAAMLLTFYIADNTLYGINIVLQLIDAGAQIEAGLK